MEEHLKQVDENLIDLENLLLAELQRLRMFDSESDYSDIDADIKEEMKDVYRSLVGQIEGDRQDWSNLSLKSFEQEWIEGRMRIVRNLLVRKLPTVFLTISQNQYRAEADKEFETDDHYAAPWLAILDDCVAMHVVDGRSIEDIVKERAQFSSRDLAHEQEKVGSKLAQSPDEIRRKLQGKASGAGASQFLARDLSNTVSPAAQATPVKRAKPKEIAQSPEEIRRKLAERQANAASGGKASFGAKDLSSPAAPSSPPPPPRKKVEEKPKEIAQSPEEIRRKLAERQSSSSGKASFGAKDIESVNDRFAQADESKQEPKQEKEPEEKPAGPARFEARDLSDPKP